MCVCVCVCVCVCDRVKESERECISVYFSQLRATQSREDWWPFSDGMELSDAERSVKLADGFERLSSGSVSGG